MESAEPVDRRSNERRSTTRDHHSSQERNDPDKAKRTAERMIIDAERFKVTVTAPSAGKTLLCHYKIKCKTYN